MERPTCTLCDGVFAGKRLIDFFGSKKEFDFIFKHALGVRKWADKSIVPYILDKGYENIRIETKEPAKYFSEVDGVVLDRPTTALFEVAAAGLPVLALYPDMVKANISLRAVEFFGKSLGEFSAEDEALAKINNFLNADLNGYKVDLPLSDEDPVEVLRNIKNRPRRKDNFRAAYLQDEKDKSREEEIYIEQ